MEKETKPPVPLFLGCKSGLQTLGEVLPRAFLPYRLQDQLLLNRRRNAMHPLHNYKTSTTTESSSDSRSTSKFIKFQIKKRSNNRSNNEKTSKNKRSRSAWIQNTRDLWDSWIEAWRGEAVVEKAREGDDGRSGGVFGLFLNGSDCYALGSEIINPKKTLLTWHCDHSYHNNDHD